MRLDKLPAIGHAERSADELLCEAITNFFLGNTEFPVNQAEINFFGHDAMPPTVYGQAWKLEPKELWMAHRLGTIYHAVNSKGEFSSAGAAAILVTDQHVRLMIGTGVYKKSTAVRGTPSQGTQLEKHFLRFVELSSIGAGDVLILTHWKLGQFFLKIPWARSLAALIAGLKANAKAPKVLEDSVVNLRPENRLGVAREAQILDVQGKV
jgi:hypothetical protein